MPSGLRKFQALRWTQNRRRVGNVLAAGAFCPKSPARAFSAIAATGWFMADISTSGSRDWLQLSRRLSIWRRQAGRNPLFRPALGVIALILFLDQLSKNLIFYGTSLGGELCTPKTEQFCGHIDVSEIFDLTMVWNKGVSFGLFAGGMVSRVALTTLAVTVAAGLFTWLCGLRRPLAAIGVAMIIGGALGNAIDRAIYGAVIDFLDFSAVHHPWFEFTGSFPYIKFGMYPFKWVFNIADAAINIGVACLLADMIFGRRSQGRAG